MRAFFFRDKALAVCGMVLTISFFLGIPSAAGDIIINVLAVNGTESAQEKDIQFSLPGEIKPDDIVDAAGLQIDYNVKDSGYFLHGKFLLKSKESRSFKVKVRDVWRISAEEFDRIREDIERGFNEMGAENGAENGKLLKDRLLLKLEYVQKEETEAEGTIDQRIDTYRTHAQTLEELRVKANFIDYWRSDAKEEESKKVIEYVVEVTNPSAKTKKVKQQHFLPLEVRPEYVIDRQGYEIRFDEKKKMPFLFKEEDLAAGEKKNIRIGIRDVWFIQQKDITFIRDRSQTIHESLKTSKFAGTAKALFDAITNYMDLIDSLQAMKQADIQQHIGAFRINQKRFDQARENLDALEKLLARYRSEMEKSRVKNVMQKIQSLKSLARVSQAIFDKKPTVNAAWKIIGSVMIFLAIFTIMHFITWFIRTSKDKKQEEMTLPKEEKKDGA